MCPGDLNWSQTNYVQRLIDPKVRAPVTLKKEPIQYVNLNFLTCELNPTCPALQHCDGLNLAELQASTKDASLSWTGKTRGSR